MNEADTCRKFIVPLLQGAGWDNDPHSIAEQRYFTKGRIVVRGNHAERRKARRADYLLRYTRDFSIAVVEAKADYKKAADGLQQAKDYAQIFSRKMVGIKREPVDYIRMYGATEGTCIDAACVSGQRYWIEHALGTGNPRTVVMHKYNVVIDISSVPVGSRFEVEVHMTLWNGLKEDDPWLAFVAFTEIPEFRIQIVFPENRAYKTRKFVKYPNQQDQEVSAESEFKQLESPQHNQIYWEIKPAVKDTTYELQWTW